MIMLFPTIRRRMSQSFCRSQAQSPHVVKRIFSDKTRLFKFETLDEAANWCLEKIKNNEGANVDNIKKRIKKAANTQTQYFQYYWRIK